jgi:hypothetical protein
MIFAHTGRHNNVNIYQSSGGNTNQTWKYHGNEKAIIAVSVLGILIHVLQ